MRKAKDYVGKLLVYLSSFITVGILLTIIAFIFIQGIGLLDLSFLTNQYNDKTYYLHFNLDKVEEGNSAEELRNELHYNERENKLIGEPTYIKNIGGALVQTEIIRNSRTEYFITYISKNSPMHKAVDRGDNPIEIKEGYIIRSINGELLEELTMKEVEDLFTVSKGTIELKITKPGGGVYTNIITTMYMVVLSLCFSAPIGIFAAIYLVEYAKPGKVVNLIRFAIESLSGIPSIIYGLFGMAFFVVFLKFNLSILSGALTVAIILLPVIIRSTEEALKAVPSSYREASFALGASKLQTISKVILPSAVPGILVAVILSIGRIIGESAALLLTAGTVSKIPESLFASGSTLTVQAYYLAKEEGNIQGACAIGIVIIFIIISLNVIAKLISKVFNKANF